MMVQAAERVLDLWKERVHPAASREQVGIAFALTAGGAVLAVMGVLLVAAGDLFLPRPSWIRELGFVAAAGGLPVFLLGLVVGLPTRQWVGALSATGAASAAVGVGLFSFWYPENWFLTVQAPNIYAIGAYLAGVSFLAAAAAAELAHYFVERARGTSAGEGATQGREVTDEEIMADLQWAGEQGWSWGGISDRVDATIKLKDDSGPLAFSGRGRRFIMEKEEGVEHEKAVDALHALKGTKRPTTDNDVASQVTYLKELKAQKAAEHEDHGFWWKLTHPVQWLKG